MSETNSVTVYLTVNAADYSSGMKKASQLADTFSGKMRSAGHSTVSSMQASSAAIRLFEGGMTNNVRAVERFVATIPGVSQALKTAFPLVGAVAFAGLIGRMGEEVYKFIETARKMPQALADGWSDLAAKGQLANDELHKTDDQLKKQIADMEGKPENNLALAIDEARIAADRLAISLRTDQKEVGTLLKDNSVGLLLSFLPGAGSSTKNVEGSINSYMADLSHLGATYSHAEHQYGEGSPQAQAALKALTDKRTSGMQWAAAMQKALTTPAEDGNYYDASGSMYTGDQKNNLTDIRGFIDKLNQQADSQQTAADIDSDTKQHDKLTAAKEYAEKVKQQQEQLFQQWQQGLDTAKSYHAYSEGDEAAYWLTMANTARTGSLSYKKALDEAHKAMGSSQRELAQEHDKWQAAQLFPDQSFTNSDNQQQGGTWNYTNDLSKDPDKAINSQGQAAVSYLRNLNQGVDIQRQNADAIQEQGLKTAIATGQLSKFDAAQAQAQLHAQEYAESLKQLQDALASVAGNSTLSDLEKKSQTSDLNNQISLLTGARQLQIIQENAAINSNTLSGSIRDTLNEYVQQATDVATQIQQVMTSAFQSVNQSLAQSLMAKANNGQEYRQGIVNGLANSARGIGTNLLNDSFQNIEGGALQKFGFGNKPDGTQGRPIWVKMAALQSAGASLLGSGTAGGFFSSFLHHIFGGGSSSSGSGGVVTPGSILGLVSSGYSLNTSTDDSWLDSLQGSFAGGGDVLANRPAIVGERGPEMFIPSTSGRIVPNGAGSTPTNQIGYIDARGATDPAAVEQAVHRAMSSYGPYAVGASVSAVREAAQRRPLSQR